MRKIFFLLVISFGILIIINIVWIGFNLYFMAIDGIQSLLQGRNLIESINYSIYLRWILLTDVLWFVFLLFFIFRRKGYKTNISLHYLDYNPITNPTITMIIPTLNEELSIGSVIQNFSKETHVKSIIVIDNNSSDRTVEIAKKAGATVITKNENKGYSHSLVLGLKEALKTNSNVIGATEADGTYNSYDIQKMVPYLDNCDIVIGTRQNQIITEKGNQNSIVHVWGNFLLAKLIQIKYFNLHHMGIINLTDVGCVYRLMKRNALEKIIDELTYPNSDKAIGGNGIGLYLTMLGIEKDLKILEIPVTFNKRIGVSKIESNKFTKIIRDGLNFLWLILSS